MYCSIEPNVIPPPPPQNFRDALDEKSETRQYLSLELQTLKSLHLASVKTNLEVYGLIDLQASLFQPFKNLQILSLDYDYLSNQLLQVRFLMAKSHPSIAFSLAALDLK